MATPKSLSIVVYASVVITMLSPASAGVVTLNFEARVRSLFGEWHATEYHEAPPIIVRVDDIITGSFTFNPALPLNSTTNWSAPMSIETHVGNLDLRSSEIFGYVMDNRRTNSWICDCAYGGPVAPPFEIVSGANYDDSADPIVDDRIEILTDVYTIVDSYRQFALIPGNSNWHWQSALSFAGRTSVLDLDNFLPGGFNVWEGFIDKTLRFGVGMGPRVGASATAQITSLSLVPEPSTLVIAAAVIVSLANANPYRTRQRNSSTPRSLTK